MALSMKFSINSYNSDKHTILTASFVLIENGAGNGNRTRLSCLEGRRTSRCTTPAEKVDQRGGVSPPEKIGTLKKGEKIFSLFPVFILYKNFFEKSTYFLRNHRQYS